MLKLMIFLNYVNISYIFILQTIAMIKIPTLPKAAMFVATLLFSLASYAQLPDFTLTLGSTPETCGGNGTITIAVSGTNPAATMLYEVYLLPNETTPVTSVTSGPVLNRPAGNYKVVATQTLGAQSNTKTGTVTIANNTIPVLFNIVSTNSRCGNDGKITVNVTSGSVATYQITSPVTTPPQASNEFNNLAPGTYTVKITGTCGEVFNPQQIVQASTGFIAIDAPELPVNILPSCNQITVSHFFGTLTNTNIFYPLTVTFTVNPPGGGTPVVITQNVPSGSPAGEDVFANIPFYNNQIYTYTVAITDACGTVFTRNVTVNKKFNASVSAAETGCSDNVFSIAPDFYSPPYTVTFTSAPVAGFNPALYNPQHPTFSGSQTKYGEEGNSLPEGTYTLVITDACGRSVTQTVVLQDADIQAEVSGEVEGCSPTGVLMARVPNRVMATAVILQAPAGYAGPMDISGSIADGSLERANMPTGHYELQITDTCGDTYIAEGDMTPTAANPTLTVLNRPGCAEGEGSVRIGLQDPDSNFTSVIITNAPVAFPHPLPYDASANAAGQYFYMGSLPQGAYTFSTLDNCNVNRTQDITIQGYAVQSNNVTITPFCGAFSVLVEHVSNGTTSASFWLQRYNEATGTWGHPGTNVAYPENSLPNGTNSVFLQNNIVQNNQQYFGEFRVLKVFYTWDDGTPTNKRCHEVIKTFTFDGYPEVTNAYSFPCANGQAEVVLEASGVAPLTYRIISKNGDTNFNVNNGTSNVFSNLEPATYMFVVTDNCGNEKQRPFTIDDLTPPTIVASGFCEGQASALSTQYFSFVTYEWFRTDNPTIVLGTGNVLDFPAYNSATDAGTYSVRLIAQGGSPCMNQTLTAFTLEPNELPNAGDDNLNIALCSNSNNVNLDTYLSAGHDAGGAWQDVTGSGQLTGNIFNTNGLAAGTYEFKYTVSGNCGLTDEATVSFNIKQQPVPPVPSPLMGICEGDNVQLTVANVPGGIFSWTGPDNFTSSEQNPVLNNVNLAAGGTYNVTVTVDGCTSSPAQVTLTVGRRPEITISGNNQICAGQSGTLTAQLNSIHGAAFVLGWYHDDELIPGEMGMSITITEPGDYKIIMESTGCTGEAVFTVTAGSIAQNIVLDGGCTNNEKYVLYVVNTDEFPGATYEWNGPGGYNFVGEEADITGLQAGDYSVTINMGGCQKTEPITVLNTFCLIPKGISPNGDAYNNSFDLSNFDVKNLRIFNRYGMRVYEKENYRDEWHGQSFAGDLPTGTYFYTLELGTGRQLTGWVYLQKEE